VTEKNILQELQEFVRKISETVQLPYNGLDVVRNGDGKLLLIELNAAPQFIKFVEDN
jgi:glutathione synthase/RimK-type ligase-like ATP-grasp enzyme